MTATRHLSELSDQELDHRRALGLDRFDEVWNGELHVVPSPSFDHQNMAAHLVAVMVPLARPVGLVVVQDLDMLDPDQGERNYRQPDVSVVRPEHTTQRGIVGGCELAVEIRSPRDETYLKFDFYAANGVRQVLVIEPATRTAELYDLHEGAYRPAVPDEGGGLTVAALPVSFETVAPPEPKLRVAWPGGTYDL